MNRIKFSHVYHKQLKGNCRWYGKLLQVLRTKKEELSKEFIDYDTRYNSKDFYELPKGELIILLFISDDDLWTTIRRYTPQKYDYYKSLEGQNFEVVLTSTTDSSKES